jgi:uncharacterized protein YdaU (DUF1376 family)
MGKLRWYKRDPNAALVGMRILSCEERGAYNTLLDLIYANDGRLVDDDRYLAGECALTARSWNRIKKRLVDLGKIKFVEGFVRNGRADKEVEFGLKKVETAQVAGKISAEKRKAGSSKNNDLGSTTVEAGVPTESRINNHSQSKESSDAGASEELPPRAAPKPKRTNAKTVLAEDWAPEDRHFAYAEQNGFDRARAAGMAEHFKAHHRAKGNRMLDWYAAWQTWVRNQVRFNDRDGGGNGGGYRPGGGQGGGSGPRGGGSSFSALAAQRARRASGKG